MCRGKPEKTLKLLEEFLELNFWMVFRRSPEEKNRTELPDECPRNCRDDFSENSWRNCQGNPFRIPLEILGQCLMKSWMNAHENVVWFSEYILEELLGKSCRNSRWNIEKNPGVLLREFSANFWKNSRKFLMNALGILERFTGEMMGNVHCIRLLVWWS